MLTQRTRRTPTDQPTVTNVMAGYLAAPNRHPAVILEGDGRVTAVRRQQWLHPLPLLHTVRQMGAAPGPMPVFSNSAAA
jgi:hypothetical protein